MKKNFFWQLIFAFVFFLFLSDSTAAQWTIAQQAIAKGDLITVYFADSKRGWVGGDDGFLAWTNDGGRSWVRQKINTTDGISDVYFRGSDKGYVISGGRIFSSTDGGQTWREEKILMNADITEGKPELSSLRFADKKNGWIVGFINRNDRVAGSLVLHSSDGGAIWRRVRAPTNPNVELIHVDFVDDENGWIVGTNGTILNTTDGGESWRTQNSGTTSTIQHVDFKNEKLGWAVGEKGLILRTEDGGATWRKVNSNVARTLLSVEFINDKNGWIVGRGGTILRSDDGGRTWIKQDGKTTENLFGLYIDKKTGWAVGGKGTILRYEK